MRILALDKQGVRMIRIIKCENCKAEGAVTIETNYEEHYEIFHCMLCNKYSTISLSRCCNAKTVTDTAKEVICIECGIIQDFEIG